MAEPDLDAFFAQLCSEGGYDTGAIGYPLLSLASGAVYGTNPPYTVTDFLLLYPKFGGTPTFTTATFTQGTAVLTVGSAAGLAIGQLVAGAGIPGGATIIAISGTDITISADTTAAAGAGQTIAIFTNPLVSLYVMNLYIALASASLLQARWGDSWVFAMGLFVAHYCTLWLRSDGGVYTTAGEAAASGVQQGIAVSKTVGPVSKTMSLLGGLESWGTLNLTSYGIQLASMANIVGMGPIYVL